MADTAHRGTTVNTSELVIRPSPFNQPYRWALYPVVVVVWLAFVYLVTHPHLLGTSSYTHSLLFTLDAAIVALPVGIAIGLVATRRHAIYLTAAHIGYKGARGAVEHERADLARIVLFSERNDQGDYAPRGALIPVIAFESTGGEELFRVSSRSWRLAYIRRVAVACGVPLEGSWEDIRDSQ